MRKPELRWLLIGTLILWSFFVLASFFAVQKPFSVANALAAGNALLDLLAAGWLALVGLAMGTWFLRRLLPTYLPPIETVVLGTGLGMGALALLSLGLGLAGFFRPAVAYGVTIGLGAIFFRQIVRLFRQWRQWHPSNLPSFLTVFYLSLIALWTLLVALLPPTDWDGLFYHLTGPKLYLQAGRVIGGVDIPHLNFPSLMEMLYAWAMLLRSDVAAKLLHAFFGLLLGGLIYLTARRLLNKKAAWLAVLVFASMPMISTLAGWAYNDLALAFYQLASLYTFVKYQIRESGNRGIRESHTSNLQSPIPPGLPARAGNLQSPTPNPRWLALSGIFAGMAMGLKYTGFVAPLVIGALILWYAVRRMPGGFDFKMLLLNLAVFFLPALLVALPWYVKNWAFTGNPVYPFLSSLFDGRYWDSFRADWYSAAGTGIGWRPGTLLALPMLLTLGVRDVNYWDGRTGPLFLLFLPLILLYGLFRYHHNASPSLASERSGDGARPIALGPLMVYALVQFVFWTLGVIWSHSLWQSRLLLPGLVALAPVVGWLWSELPGFDLPQFSLSRFANVVIGLTLALTLIDTGLMTLKINPLPYLVGAETRDEYLTRRLGAYYAAMQQINERLPSDAVIVFLWEPRSYYCQRDCRPDSILDQLAHDQYVYGNASRIFDAWKKAGITHVLLHRQGLGFIKGEGTETLYQPAIEQLVSMENQYFEEVFDVAGAYQVYSLRR
jgi:4-amino-4-deoxy-L-arabinose transferase-like glycosyltransferase